MIIHHHFDQFRLTNYLGAKWNIHWSLQLNTNNVTSGMINNIQRRVNMFGIVNLVRSGRFVIENSVNFRIRVYVSFAEPTLRKSGI